jgi:hypothetical protein
LSKKTPKKAEPCSNASGPEQQQLIREWQAAWPGALAAWSSYTLLREPRFFASHAEAQPDGLDHQIAAIRLRDQAVMINAAHVLELGLQHFGLQILAHEVGHHVYVPGNLTDNGRLHAACARMLQGLPAQSAALVANLYADQLLNDRLQRHANLDMAAVYRQMAAHSTGPGSKVWQVTMRAYEQLWRSPVGTLTPPVPAEMDGDALLLSRLIRSFAGDWLRGARRYAVVLYPYLAADATGEQTFLKLGLHDTRQAAARAPGDEPGDAIPDGLVEVDSSELDDGDDGGDLDGPDKPRSATGKPTETGANKPATGQCREPFEYGALLRSLGLDLSDHEITVRYYRERARPHLIPFPARRQPHVTEPLAEGQRSWEAGEPIEALDVLGSVLASPHVVPGVTTVQTVYGEAPGSDPARVPMDLDIYIDCSGSMPNPTVTTSYLTLCGTILAMSALRAGAAVQATLWSSPGSFETTGGFLRDEKRVLSTVTGFISGSTAFPLHLLRDTYAKRKPSDPPAHIVVISDDGADTMLAEDERHGDGLAICAQAIAKARGGGTLVLNLPNLAHWKAREPLAKLGYRIHAVTRWEELVAFARAFVRENYGGNGG